MTQIMVYSGGTGAASLHAGVLLKKWGIPVVTHPTPEATHLLLDVPLREVPIPLLERLPEQITVVGGNLDVPALNGYRKLDLLQKEEPQSKCGRAYRMPCVYCYRGRLRVSSCQR